MRNARVLLSAITAACVIAAPLSRAADAPRRVQPPVWSQDVLDAFFDDAREQLVGERPATASEADPGAAEVAKPASGDDVRGDAEFRWSALVEAETLTAEIKRINNQLGLALRNSSRFQGGGNLICRRDFGLLAVLFGVVSEFDGDVRWQRSGEQMRSVCFRACQNCKTASAQSFAAAQNVQAMLDDLFRGQAPDGASSGDAASLVERPLLMQCMELAVKERLSPALANARDFRRRSQQAAEQAQVLAVLAEIMQREGYEYADDDTYLDEARQLRAAASELSQAAKEKNYEAARAAAGRVGQSCSRCHEGYRG